MATIVAPLDPLNIGIAEAAIDRLGNPADPAVCAALDILDPPPPRRLPGRHRHAATGREDPSEARGVHFMSLHAIRSFRPGRAHLVLEFSADGPLDRALDQITRAIGDELAVVFALASDWREGDIGRYLRRHIVRNGCGPGRAPGLCHSGTPGKTVGRIRYEARIAAQCAEILDRKAQDARARHDGATTASKSALERLTEVREVLKHETAALRTPRSKIAWSPTPAAIVISTLVLRFILTFLWPLLLALALVGLAGGFAALLFPARGEPEPLSILDFALGVLFSVYAAAPFIFGVAAVAMLWVYVRLRRMEETDWTSDLAPDREVLREMRARENQGAQNHMVSVTELKSGVVRHLTTHLGFFLLSTLAPLLYKPGYLGAVGTIHFARWVTVPGTRDFLFFSNYGGSWEAYLEDFITLAHQGLTGVWSNTVGFPRSENLIGKGATDGERFKRFARRSMQPTRFWYSAYPELNTDMIHANSGIVRGLAAAMTEDDAVSWLCYFGSALRPDDHLLGSEVQSLLFGGLGFLHHSSIALWRLSDDVGKSRAWLAGVSRYIAYNDGRRVRDDDAIHAVVQLGVSSRGLARLGLPKDALETFPPAFLDDMTDPDRLRILGDVGPNAPDHWWWGKAPSDVAVLIYAESEAALAAMSAEIERLGVLHEAKLAHLIPMEPFAGDDRNVEPFGFRDGISQPLMRGTYKALKSGDPLHVVEPGEFVLGYPDNRGNLPPVPTLDPLEDPDNELPVLRPSTDFVRNTVNNARDLGANGSYLVIRQLEQDVEAFHDYSRKEAEALKARLPAPYEVTPKFIEAKLMGRWHNGAPLVRAPYTEPTGSADIRENGFQFGAEDPGGIGCPFGAHVRRANPRESLNPGSKDQVAISNRHRIMRVGRKYKPQPGQKPGLVFMCLNGDIERQFEFVQQTWILGNVISLSCPITLSGEGDPIIGARGTERARFTIPTPDGPVRLGEMSRFVATRGGGYFFLPSRRLVRYLSKPPIRPTATAAAGAGPS